MKKIDRHKMFICKMIENLMLQGEGLQAKPRTKFHRAHLSWVFYWCEEKVIKNNLGKTGVVFAGTSTSLTILEGTEGSNLEHELKQKPVEVMITGLHIMPYSACFLLLSRTTSLEVAPPSVSRSLPHRSTRCLSGLPTGKYDGCIFLLQVPSSKMNLACGKLT